MNVHIAYSVDRLVGAFGPGAERFEIEEIGIIPAQFSQSFFALGDVVGDRFLYVWLSGGRHIVSHAVLTTVGRSESHHEIVSPRCGDELGFGSIMDIDLSQMSVQEHEGGYNGCHSCQRQRGALESGFSGVNEHIDDDGDQHDQNAEFYH